MTTQRVQYGSLTRTSEGVLLGGMAALIIGAFFAAEGLLGYSHNYSIFWEGLDHITEIYGGFAVALLGLIASSYVYIRQ